VISFVITRISRLMSVYRLSYQWRLPLWRGQVGKTPPLRAKSGEAEGFQSVRLTFEYNISYVSFKQLYLVLSCNKNLCFLDACGLFIADFDFHRLKRGFGRCNAPQTEPDVTCR
jgi:hypothetical protein